MKISMKQTDNGITAALNGMADRMRDLTPCMTQVAGILMDSMEENFAKGGRPKWEPSKRVKKLGGQTLIKSGQLKSSISSSADATSATVGTNKVYAAIQQFGGDIHQGARSELFTRNRKGNLFSKGTKKGRGMTFKDRNIHIPARPFIGVTDKEIGKIREKIEQHVTGNRQ